MLENILSMPDLPILRRKQAKLRSLYIQSLKGPDKSLQVCKESKAQKV